MKRLTFLTLLLLPGFCAADACAGGIELLGVFGNDSLFNSDGSGVTGSIELAVKKDRWRFGSGAYLATPELLSEKRPNDDPLAELSRLTVWVGRSASLNETIDALFSGRIGAQGGVIDDIGFEMQDAAHSLINKGSRNLESTNQTEAVLGVSGWIRTVLIRRPLRSFSFNAFPYGHASLGNETIEAGAGMVAALQPQGALPLSLLLPKNGSYAPVFGGTGFGLFASIRGVLRETLYDDLQEPVIGELGVIGQTTIFDSFLLGASASCTTEPYEGAIGSDCKTMLQIGYRWLPTRDSTNRDSE